MNIIRSLDYFAILLLLTADALISASLAVAPHDDASSNSAHNDMMQAYELHYAALVIAAIALVLTASTAIYRGLYYETRMYSEGRNRAETAKEYKGVSLIINLFSLMGILGNMKFLSDTLNNNSDTALKETPFKEISIFLIVLISLNILTLSVCAWANSHREGSTVSAIELSGAPGSSYST